MSDLCKNSDLLNEVCTLVSLDMWRQEELNVWILIMLVNASERNYVAFEKALRAKTCFQQMWKKSTTWIERRMDSQMFASLSMENQQNSRNGFLFLTHFKRKISENLKILKKNWRGVAIAVGVILVVRSQRLPICTITLHVQSVDTKSFDDS